MLQHLLFLVPCHYPIMITYIMSIFFMEALRKYEGGPPTVSVLYHSAMLCFILSIILQLTMCIG